MRFDLVEPESIPTGTSTICRISAHGTRWRVEVESWEGADGWQGRLVFRPDAPSAAIEPRAGPPSLRGRSRTDVLDAAHRLPEHRLRVLLHSFG